MYYRFEGNEMNIIKSGIICSWPTYKGAEIVHVSKNGWCKCKWSDGRTFNARAHWLCGYKEEYKIIPD